MSKTEAMAARANLEQGGVMEDALRCFPAFYDNKEACEMLAWIETQLASEEEKAEGEREKLAQEAETQAWDDALKDALWKIDHSNLPHSNYATDLAEACCALSAMLGDKGDKVKATKDALAQAARKVLEQADLLLDAVATALNVDQHEQGWDCHD